jgi:hypothetical protein
MLIFDGIEHGCLCGNRMRELQGCFCKQSMHCMSIETSMSAVQAAIMPRFIRGEFNNLQDMSLQAADKTADGALDGVMTEHDIAATEADGDREIFFQNKLIALQTYFYMPCKLTRRLNQ